MSVDRNELLRLLERAERMTAQAVEASPGSTLFASIAHQLSVIRQHVERRGAFDAAIQARVTLGVLAVREFEQTDPEYAEVLEQINFMYRYDGVLR